MTVDLLSDSDRSRVGWWLFTIGLGVVLVAILAGFIGAFVLGLFVYYATRPIYDRIEGGLLPRTVTALAALFIIALPVIVLLAYTIVIALTELSSIIGTNSETFQTFIQPYLDLSAQTGTPQQVLASLVENPQQLQALGSPETLRRILGILGTYARVFVSGFLQVFIALAVAFYLLRDDYKLAGWFRMAISDDNTLHAYATAVDRDLKTIYFGNILNAFVVAIMAALSYNALNLVSPAGLAIPVPTLLGLLTGAASLIPVIGMKIVYVPVGIYLFGVALVTDTGFLWFPLVFLTITVLVVDGMTEILLRPYISGRNLHVGLVLFAYILGPIFFGWYGLFLGPLLLVFLVHLARIILPELIQGKPLTPSAIGGDPIPDMADEERTTDQTTISDFDAPASETGSHDEEPEQ